MLKKAISITDKIINSLIIIFCTLLILIGGYAIYDSYQIYDDTTLDDTIINLNPKENDEFNLKALQELNPDIEGWITIFETTIDYPVLHSHDNLEYLNENYRKEHTTGGSIFSDYRNKFGFQDDYTILYGHNMAVGQMFSDIKKYEDSNYFNQHLYGVLYTIDKTYKIEVLYLAHVNAYHDDIYNLITYANGHNAELQALVQSKATWKNQVNPIDKLLLLSTCDSYGSNDRAILLANLSATNDAEIDQLKNTARELTKSSNNQSGNIHAVSTLLKILLTLSILIIIIILIWKFYHKYRTLHKKP